MCLFPKVIKNPSKSLISRLTPDEYRSLGRSRIDFYNDHFVNVDRMEVPCRKCIECLKQRAKSWRTRILDEVLVPTKVGKTSVRYPLFVTFTIAPEHYDSVTSDVKGSFRKIFERYRYVFKSSCRHFLISEYGDATHHTGRLHFHGIFFLGDALKAFDSLSPDDRASYLPDRFAGRKVPRLLPVLDDSDDRLSLVQRAAFSHYLEVELNLFGFMDVGYNCSPKAVTYITTYMTKHPDFEYLLVSAGFGRAWFDKNKRRLICEGYRKAVHDGSPFGRFLPKYYQDKCFTLVDKINYAYDVTRPQLLNIRSPEDAWRLNPRSRRFVTEADYKLWLKTFVKYKPFDYMDLSEIKPNFTRDELNASVYLCSAEAIELRSFMRSFS